MYCTVVKAKKENVLRKEQFIKGLGEKEHVLPKESKEIHNLLASFRKVQTSKGDKLSKKNLCFSFGIDYHTGKLMSDKLELGTFTKYKAQPKSKNEKYDTLILI